MGLKFASRRWTLDDFMSYSISTTFYICETRTGDNNIDTRYKRQVSADMEDGADIDEDTWTQKANWQLVET